MPALWPVRPRPLPDELLSSWVVRLAAANGIKVGTFLYVVCGRRRAFSQDMDRYVPPDYAQALSDGTGVPRGVVHAMALAAFAGTIFPRFTRRGCTPWLLPVGVYHAERQRYGLQFCPECLDADPTPYLRRRWRLGCVTMCLTHQRLLLDRCPSCRTPLAPHRGTLGDRRRFLGADLRHCAPCGGLLTHAQRAAAPPRIQALQRLLDRSLDEDYPRTGGRGGRTPLLEMLSVLRQFCRLLAHGRWGAPLRRAAMALGAVLPSPQITAGRFVLEESSIEERVALLDGALLLWERWPKSFAALCRQHGAWRSNLLADFPAAPDWYIRQVESVLYLPGFFPGNAEYPPSTWRRHRS